MLVTWRNDEYEFFPRTIDGGPDEWTKFSNVDAPIFGADTESVQLADRYEPQCFSFSSPWEDGDHLNYIPENAFALKPFLSFIIGRYADRLLETKNAFIYFHNLEYDWLQLVKNDARLLEMARIGVGTNKDMKLFKIGAYDVILKKDGIFSGSAPHFTIRVAPRKGGFNLNFLDSFSFFPGSLARVSKDLGLGEKMERQTDLGQTDYRTAPDGEDKTYFEEYAKIDARNTRLIGEAIRELHEQADMTKIRASAPSYAIARVFHLMGTGRSIQTGDRDPAIMQLIFDTYRGGRTGGIYHGPVKNLAVLDFHSSYPASMLGLPSFTPDMGYVRVDDLRLENVIQILEHTGNAFLRVSGRETDARYPSLITTHNGKLTPIYGDFENQATTGVELLVGIKSGSLENLVIHECIVLLDMREKPFLPFREFALVAYERKRNAEKGTTVYTSAKLELNASYGKLIESRSQTLVGAGDYDVLLPYIDGMEKEFGNYYYQKYMEALDQDKHLMDVYTDILEEICGNFDEETRAAMRDKMFGDYSISGRVYGRYVIPAAASLITATSRARLCAVMKATQALYWDTDSVFVEDFDLETIQANLAQIAAWFPANVKPPIIGDELGDLETEIQGANGWLAGIKRYYLETPDGKTKAATHGIPSFPADKTPDVIRALATGTDYQYEAKSRPLKAKEAKTVEDIGSFRSRSYVSRFHLDDRIEWEPVGGGYLGEVKPFSEMDVKEVTEEQYQRILERLYAKELKTDPLREACLLHGFIQIPKEGESFRREYERLSRSTKSKYFRRVGVPLDVFAHAQGITANELMEVLT